MRPLLSVAEMREWEARLIAAGVPGIVLMENAGRGAAHLIGLQDRPRHEAPRSLPTSLQGSCVRCADEKSLAGVEYLIVCGGGNNGGDGYVVGRHLLGRGASVRVLVTKPTSALSGDARIAARAFEAVGGQPEAASSAEIANFSGGILVDALLGTGLRGPVEGELVELILAMNESPAKTVALDVPSGLDVDLGRVHEGPKGRVAVRAAHTVTFGHLKRGLLTTVGHELAGRITLANIGVPSDLGAIFPPAAWLLEEQDIGAALVPRPPTAHKGRAGEVAILGGSPGMMGAVHLSARAALRAGAGLVTLHAERSVAEALDREVLEVMTRGYESLHGGAFAVQPGRAGAIVLGPGLGRSDAALQLYQGALHAAQEGRLPLVIDADGLRLSLGRLPALRTLAESGVPLVLTPHPGEAAHLLECSVAEIEGDRFGAAARLAHKSGAIVVLKGSRTIIAAPDAPPWVSAFGSAALATAGSGDVLAGILGSLIAQDAAAAPDSEPDYAAIVCAAVGLHGLAGELFEAENGNAGGLASDWVELLPRVRARLLGEGLA
jgi:ADP-dependent NAD(P)H-hydrate dehydratase / NAD(P)H-hydrate epimerase